MVMGSNLVGNEIGTLFFFKKKSVVLEGIGEGKRKPRGAQPRRVGNHHIMTL